MRSPSLSPTPQPAVRAVARGTARCRLPAVEQDPSAITVRGDGFQYRFDTGTGMPTSMLVGDQEMFTAPAEVNIWRAPTDNDRRIRLEWEQAATRMPRSAHMSVPPRPLTGPWWCAPA